MKSLAIGGLAFLMATGAFAQRTIPGAGTNAGFGNVVFPAGRPTTGTPFTFTQNSFATQIGNVVAGRPAFNGNFRRNPNTGTVVYVPYAYPVPVGGGNYGYGYGDAPPQQQQPNVTIIYPPQQPTPVIITQGAPAGPPADIPRSQIREYGPPEPSTAAENPQAESQYYLLAFKDHSIYSAVGYWVDGDTMHYITTGNVHNQVSLALVDRELTEQLNKGRGMQVHLPAAPSR